MIGFKQTQNPVQFYLNQTISKSALVFGLIIFLTYTAVAQEVSKLDDIFNKLNQNISDTVQLNRVDSILESKLGYDTARLWKECKIILQKAKDTDNVYVQQRGYAFLGILYFDSDIEEASNALNNFHKSYDLALEIGDSIQTYKVLNQLGYFYSAFGFTFEGEDFRRKAIAINERLVKKDTTYYRKLVQNYIALGGFYLITKRDSAGLDYFDKARALPTVDSSEYVTLYYFESLAHILKGENALGLEIAQKALPLIDEAAGLDMYKEYYILLGNAYAKNHQYDSSEYYLKKVLGIIGNNKDGYADNYLGQCYHLAYEIYKATGRLNEAISYKEKSDSVFLKLRGRWSKAYLSLDSARSLIKKKNETKKEEQYQSYIQDLKKNKLLLSGGIVFLLLIAGGTYWMLLKRNRRNIINAREAIRKKNRELTTASLKLIEHQGLMLETANRLKALNKTGDERLSEGIRSLIRSIENHHNDDQHWQQFKEIFEQVNDNFFTELAKKHEKLTNNEMKLCALLRLNFENKDIARIMGINPDSVHKARHRLRKKLELEKETNLESYFMQI